MTKQQTKSERALELYEKGIAPSQIAERIGSSLNNVCAMIAYARKRRDLKLCQTASTNN